MPTEKQIKAVNKMVENGGIASKAMIDSGYSENTAKTPSKLTESKGFKELCEECGLTDNLIVNSLVEDIKLKPQNRIGELGLGAKMKGLVTEKTEVSGAVEVINKINYIVPDGTDSTSNIETTSSLSSPKQ